MGSRDGRQMISTPNGSHIFPSINLSTPLVGRHPHTPTNDNDDGWETDLEFPERLVRTASRRRRRRTQNDSSATNSRRTNFRITVINGTDDEDDGNQSSDGQEFTKHLLKREEERKMREYASSRATSTIPPDVAPPPLNDEEAPKWAVSTQTLTTMSSMDIDLPSSTNMNSTSNYQANTPRTSSEKWHSENGDSQTLSITGQSRTRHGQRRPESPGWEDEETERTVSRGTSRGLVSCSICTFGIFKKKFYTRHLCNAENRFF